MILIASCKKDVIQYPVSYENDRSKFMEFSQNLNKEILEDDTKKIQNYIDSSQLKFNHTSYGFWISNSGKSSENTAKLGDLVKFNYEVSDFNENLVYSEKETGNRQAVLGRESLPRGLHISLQLIEKGDSAITLMPSFLAYGGYGDLNKIGGNEPLIFKIKVLDIKKKER